MEGLVKARVAEVSGSKVRIELPDGKALTVGDRKHLCRPEMVDSVRWIVISSFAFEVKKLQAPVYDIVIKREGGGTYLFSGRIFQKDEGFLILDTGYGMIVIQCVVSVLENLMAGDHVEASSNGGSTSIANISTDSGRMAIE